VHVGGPSETERGFVCTAPNTASVWIRRRPISRRGVAMTVNADNSRRPIARGKGPATAMIDGVVLPVGTQAQWEGDQSQQNGWLTAIAIPNPASPLPECTQWESGADLYRVRPIGADALTAGRALTKRKMDQRGRCATQTDRFDWARPRAPVSGTRGPLRFGFAQRVNRPRASWSNSCRRPPPIRFVLPDRPLSQTRFKIRIPLPVPFAAPKPR